MFPVFFAHFQGMGISDSVERCPIIQAFHGIRASLTRIVTAVVIGDRGL